MADMSEKERLWLSSFDSKGALNKAVAMRLDIPVGDLIERGLVRNVGPATESMWDLRITQRGRDAIKSDG
jgi:hypothetical protein